ncbi:toxin-antitoxin system YwqK family antitoxin [Fusobacterium perfoetens]|uniref:toxin-antitoxin system YwqK family antitoxin n=1 Tax=Fusobacterium perfoetens TaxID=852 RepID=UPI0026EB5561|nr:hypothetical protein [Fusobacterium perfoetens]
MENQKSIVLDYLESGLKKKNEIMFNLKNMEKFNFSKNKIYIFIFLHIVTILGFYIIFYIISKPVFYYKNFMEYVLSPVLSVINIIAIIYMIALIITLKQRVIKIYFDNSYIKIKLFKKVYFDDIATIRVSQIKNKVEIGIIKYNGENITLDTEIKNPNSIEKITKEEENFEKFLVILKETFKEKLIVEEYQREATKKSILKIIGKVIVVYIIINLLSSLTSKMMINYTRGKDFSRNGVETETYGGGYAEIPYKHGQKNGIAKYYTSDKRLEKEVEYKKGERVFEIEYDKNGKLYMETKYKNDKIGHHKSYYPNGNIDMEFIYEDNFSKEKYFSEDGVLVKEENYKDGEPHGKRTVYYPNGKTFIELEYNEGKVVWPIKVYDKDGKLKLEEVARGSDNFIERKIYNNDGKLKDTQIIKKEDLEVWEIYYNKIRALNYFTQKGVMEREIELLEKI